MRIVILTSDNRERYKDYTHPTPYFGPAPEALLQGFVSLGKDVEVHVVSCLQRPAPAPEKIADNLWYHAVHVPKLGWLRTLYLGCIRAVREKLREIQPDIVHGQGTERDCALSAIFAGFPNVLTIHGNMRAVAKYNPNSFHIITGKLEAFALKRTAGVFCNSVYTEGLVAPLAKRVWRVPNALRRPFFEQPVESKKETPPVILNIGVIFPYKRQLEILAVARHLHRRGFKFDVRFIGSMESPLKYCADFRREIAVAEKEGYARHVDQMNAQELIRALDAASAMIHFPSEEAFGLVAAEALSRNLKLFASSHGGVSDIASGVEGAEVIPGEDWAALENTLARWLEAGHPRPQTAAQTARERYAPEVVARQHVEIYRSLLNQNPNNS
jgi:glycosyltransferase involved in cell wall biosynthesis